MSWRLLLLINDSSKETKLIHVFLLGKNSHCYPCQQQCLNYIFESCLAATLRNGCKTWENAYAGIKFTKEVYLLTDYTILTSIHKRTQQGLSQPEYYYEQLQPKLQENQRLLLEWTPMLNQCKKLEVAFHNLLVGVMMYWPINTCPNILFAVVS